MMLRLRSKPAEQRAGDTDYGASSRRGTVRAVDDLGRVVIPAEVRRAANIERGDQVEFSYVDGAITLTKMPVVETNPASRW